MTSVRVSVVIDRPPAAVWDELRDIASHVHWMEDAVHITFTSAAHEGVGTAFDCLSKLGPLRITDKMLVTEWVDGEAMAVRHEGIVTGTGRFTLHPEGPAATRFTWTEELTFPARFAGPAGAAVAGPLFRRVWRTNLANLKARIESRSFEPLAVPEPDQDRHGDGQDLAEKQDAKREQLDRKGQRRPTEEQG